MKTIEQIKDLGKDKSLENLDTLFSLYNENLKTELKREIASSIGRHAKFDKNKVLCFIKEHYKAALMDIVYQFYRTCLYNHKDEDFYNLMIEIEEYFQNEMIEKMKSFYFNKEKNKK